MATRRTLNLLELSLSVTYLTIPVFAFTAAKYLRFATSYFSKVDADPSSYVLWIIVVTSIWALVVEKCKLNRAQTIVTFHTGIQAMGKAVFYTMTVAFALFFFYRHALFSRIFVVTGCVLTFLLSLLVLHIFRAVLRSKWGPFKSPLRIAILGVEGYEARLGKHLETMTMVPIEVACVIPLGAQGFLRAQVADCALRPSGRGRRHLPLPRSSRRIAAHSPRRPAEFIATPEASVRAGSRGARYG